MKKILSLVLALMLSMAAVVAVAGAESAPSPELAQPNVTAVEGGILTPVLMDKAEFIEAYKADPVQLLGAVAAQKVEGMPLIAFAKGILQIMPGAQFVKVVTTEITITLKDGEKIVVTLSIPGWPGDAVQAEVIDGEIVFELDEAALIALQNIPGFNGEILFTFFKGELPADNA